MNNFVIEYGAKYTKFSLWVNLEPIAFKIKDFEGESTNKLQREIRRTYKAYNKILANKKLGSVDHTLVIPYKSNEYTQYTSFRVEYLDTGLEESIRETIKSKVPFTDEKSSGIFDWTVQIDAPLEDYQSIYGASISQTHLQMILDVLSNVGITEYSITAPGQLLTQLAPRQDKPYLIIDIGQNTMVGAVYNGELQTVQYTSTGSKEITNFLSKIYTDNGRLYNAKHNSSYSDMKSLLTKFSSKFQSNTDSTTPYADNNVADLLDRTLNPVIDCISNTKASFENQYKIDIKEFVLVGGMANLKGFNLIEDKFKITRIDPFESTPYSVVPFELRNYVALSYSAVKLHLQGDLLDFSQADNSNFFKVMKVFKMLKQIEHFVYPTIVATFLIIASTVGQGFLYDKTIPEFDSKLADVSSTVSTMESELKTTQKNLEMLEQDVLAETYDWSQVLTALQSNTPKGACITRIHTDSKNVNVVNIEGYTDSRFKAVDLSTLIQKTTFKETQVDSVETVKTIYNTPVYKFNIVCTQKR